MELEKRNNRPSTSKKTAVRLQQCLEAMLILNRDWSGQSRDTLTSCLIRRAGSYLKRLHLNWRIINNSVFCQAPSYLKPALRRPGSLEQTLFDYAFAKQLEALDGHGYTGSNLDFMFSILLELYTISSLSFILQWKRTRPARFLPLRITRERSAVAPRTRKISSQIPPAMFKRLIEHSVLSPFVS